MRLRSDIWVAAYLRRCAIEGAFAVLRRRGAAEAGTILVKVDRLDGSACVVGPAPQSAYESDATDRLFMRLHAAETVDLPDAEALVQRELKFDPDIWLVEVEDRAGRLFLNLVSV